MHIYIDESGQFRPLDGVKPRAAAVAAVVIPSAQRVAFGKAFRRLKRQRRSGSSELKGSSVSEGVAAEFLDILRQHDVIAEAVVLNVGHHDSASVTQFKLAQADALQDELELAGGPTPAPLLEIRRTLKDLPNQLFLQAFSLLHLIPRVLETATLYHVQRRPHELGRFLWRIDAKDHAVTRMEGLWRDLLGPFVQTLNTDAPLAMLPGCDYSYFDRFNSRGIVSDRRESPVSTDLSLVLEDFRFVPSTTDLGVQAADIVSSLITRALNGSLRIEGWADLGRLFIKRDGRAVRMIALDVGSDLTRLPRDICDEWKQTIRHLTRHARPMLTAETARRLNQTAPN